MLTPDFTFGHRITARKWLERGISGNVYGPEESYPCRVDFQRKRTRRQTNTAVQEVIASGTVFLTAGVRLPPESLILFEGQRYSVLSCRPCYDFMGRENHVEVEIQ